MFNASNIHYIMFCIVWNDGRFVSPRSRSTVLQKFINRKDVFVLCKHSIKIFNERYYNSNHHEATSKDLRKVLLQNLFQLRPEKRPSHPWGIALHEIHRIIIQKNFGLWWQNNKISLSMILEDFEGSWAIKLKSKKTQCYLFCFKKQFPKRNVVKLEIFDASIEEKFEWALANNETWAKHTLNSWRCLKARRLQINTLLFVFFCQQPTSRDLLRNFFDLSYCLRIVGCWNFFVSREGILKRIPLESNMIPNCQRSNRMSSRDL